VEPREAQPESHAHWAAKDGEGHSHNSLQTVRAIAQTGVNVISVGALTHSAPALDVALDAD
jgi:nicotinate-nucleotide pyrophosphorylase